MTDASSQTNPKAYGELGVSSHKVVHSIQT